MFEAGTAGAVPASCCGEIVASGGRGPARVLPAASRIPRRVVRRTTSASVLAADGGALSGGQQASGGCPENNAVRPSERSVPTQPAVVESARAELLTGD